MSRTLPSAMPMAGLFPGNDALNGAQIYQKVMGCVGTAGGPF